MPTNISKELIEKTVNYLATRPWMEVSPLMNEWVKTLNPPAPKVEEKTAEE